MLTGPRERLALVNIPCLLIHRGGPQKPIYLEGLTGWSRKRGLIAKFEREYSYYLGACKQLNISSRRLWLKKAKKWRLGRYSQRTFPHSDPLTMHLLLTEDISLVSMRDSLVRIGRLRATESFDVEVPAGYGIEASRGSHSHIMR